MSRLVLSLTLSLVACTEEDFNNSGERETAVSLSAAFTELSAVDVYDMDGEFLESIDASTDDPQPFLIGSYYMDFEDANGNHSFLEDGRLTFAPMGNGFLPLDGPFDIGADAPVWLVDIDPVLEANARLTIRAADGDESLRPWKWMFPNWQMNLPEEERDLIEGDPMAKSFSTTTGSSSARLRVTWEASFAMTGKYTTSSTDSTTCNTSTGCWTRSSSIPGSTSSYYAVWDYDSNGTGYLDYDESAWDTLTGHYTDGDASCAQSGYSASPTCNLSSAIGVGTAKNYTCQSSSGSCTGGSSSSATKPRGGQCKAFQNLILYRSGQYGGGSWDTLPSDGVISGYSSSGSDAPTTSTSNIAVGDVLRRLSSVHSMTVVAYDSATQRALVVDSNMTGSTSTSYSEYIAARVVGFSTTTYSSYSLLSNYRNLKCVYAGSC